MADTDLFKCLERVRVIKEDLEYILNHSAEETCKYFEFCPSTRVSLSPMVEQSFKKFALNKNFATKAKTIGGELMIKLSSRMRSFDDRYSS